LRVRDLIEELRKLLRLAAPIAFTQAGYALMGLIDTAVVGRLGAGPLGAVGLANGLFMALAVIGLGTMMGLDPLFAQALGAKDERRARELIWQGIWLSLLATAALALPIAATPLLLRPAGIAPEVARDASLFLWYRLPSLWPMLAYAGLRSYLQAAHRLRALVISTVLANVANLLLDVGLVFGRAGLPRMGAPGAGLATSLCALLQFAVLALSLRGGAPVARGIRAADQRKSLSLGIPIGLQLGAEVGIFAMVGLLAGRLCQRPLAAHQVAIPLRVSPFASL